MSSRRTESVSNKELVMMRRRITFLSSFAAVLLCCVVMPIVAEEKEEAAHYSKIDTMRELLNAWSIRTREERSAPLAFVQEPVMKYHDPKYTVTKGAIWRLGTTGRPWAYIAVEMDHPEGTAGRATYEFLSLTEKPFRLGGRDRIQTAARCTRTGGDRGRTTGPDAAAGNSIFSRGDAGTGTDLSESASYSLRPVSTDRCREFGCRGVLF